MEQQTSKKHNKIPARQPSERQKVAVMYLVENGSSKADALRAAGYSEAVITQPHKVFNSPRVQEIMERCGVNPEMVINSVKKKLNRRKVINFSMPMHVDDIEYEIEKGVEKPKFEVCEITDGDILDIYETDESRVLRIEVRTSTTGKKHRQIWLSVPDMFSKADAEQKLIAIFGLEAPRNVKLDADIKHFTLTGLRKEIEDNGFEIIKPRIYEQ